MTSAMRASAAFCALAVATGAAAQTTFQFSGPASFEAGPNPWALATADLDGDQAVDVAVASRDPTALWILFNDGSGGFGEPTVITEFASVTLCDVIAADMNLDGHPDLVLTFRGDIYDDIDSGVSVLLNDGTGSFTDTGLGLTCTTVVASSVAHFNGDALPDVASTAQLCFQASVLLGMGAGALGPHVEYGDGYVSRGNAVADLDGDGRLDVAYANATNSVTLLLGNGDGTFFYSFDNRQEVNDLPQAVYAADLDNDDLPEVFTANRYSDDLTILFNDGGLSFSRVDVPAGDEAIAAVAADLDQDGLPDLAVGNDAGQTVTFRRGNGPRSFAAPQSVPVDGSIRDVTAADLDGDGDPDIAAASDGAGTLSVLLNETPAATPGDVNGDGIVGVEDLLALLAEWGPCEVGEACRADVDHDGIVGVTDLLALLGNWG